MKFDTNLDAKLDRNLRQVHAHFEQRAFDYDDLIPRLIPRYREQHDLILQLIPFESNANIKVIDLGGIYSKVRQFPTSST